MKSCLDEVPPCPLPPLTLTHVAVNVGDDDALSIGGHRHLHTIAHQQQLLTDGRAAAADEVRGTNACVPHLQRDTAQHSTSHHSTNGIELFGGLVELVRHTDDARVLHLQNDTAQHIASQQTQHSTSHHSTNGIDCLDRKWSCG